MNIVRSGLAALAAAGLGLTAAAAPAPAPKPQGPISDFLRLRAALPPGAPPNVVEVRGDGDTITITHRVIVSLPVVQQVNVERDGRTVTQQRTVMVSQVRLMKSRAAVKDCKVFRVSKEGKLEAVAAAKAAELWQKPLSVLSGTSAEVDPRHLELVKPGTLYLVLPTAGMMPGEALPVPPRGVPVKKE